MSKTWSSYRRKLINIEKSVYNDEVSYLLNKHYNELHSMLVRCEKDEETFNDTYLKLTYNYDLSKDFIELFKYYFKLLKGAYYRDDKTSNYYLIMNDNFISNASTDYFEEEELPTQKLSELKEKIYAYLKESTKEANKKD